MLSASGTRVHSVPQLSAWIWVTEMSNKNSHYGKTCLITGLKVGICLLSVLLSEANNSHPLLLSHPDAFHQALQRLILNLGLTRIYTTPQAVTKCGIRSLQRHLEQSASLGSSELWLHIQNEQVV